MANEEDAAVDEELTDFDPADPQGAAEAEPDETEETEEAEQPEEASDSSTDNEDEVPPERLAEVTKARRNAERQAEYWKERALALESDKPKETDSPVTLDRTLEDFEYDVDAFTKYVTEQTQKSFEARTREQQNSAEQEQVIRQHLQREAEYSAEVEDYEQTAFNPKLPVSPLMADIIRRSDIGPQMLYHLGKNPDVSAKIASLPDQLQGLEMGRIAERITAAPPQESRTPPPPSTLEGKKSPRKILSNHPDSDQLSDEEWLRRENERLARLGRKY